MVKTLVQKFSSFLGITPDELKKAAIFPLGLLIMVILGDILWNAVGFPDVKEVIEIIKQLFINYGYPLVFFSAFIESALLVGLYVPGSVALILAATLAGQGVLNIWLVILYITLGCMSAVVTNYALGKYGWYHVLARFGLKGTIDKVKARAEAVGFKLIHFTYFNPNLASFTATSFGILRVSFPRFFFHSLIAFIYWNCMWGFGFYFFGNWIEEYINYQSLVIIIFAVIGIRLGYVMIRKRLNVV